MEIQKPNLGVYDSQYLQVLKTGRAISVKPNVLRDLEDPVTRAFVLTDAISLSGEAKQLLKKILDKEDTVRDKYEEGVLLSEDDWLELYQALKKFVSQNAKNKIQGQEKQGKDGKERKVDLLSLKQQPLIVDEKQRRPHKENKVPKKTFSGVEELLNQMIVHAPSDTVRSQLITELAVFGEELVRSCKQFGIRIVVLKQREHLGQLKIGGTTIVGPGEKTFDGRPWETVRGIYDSSRRIIVLGEELIGLPNDVPSRHEFAHAYDDMYTTKHNRKLPLSVQLWNLFKDERISHISSYAATKPAEYFAETVEAFLNPKKRLVLSQYDPRMTQFLTKLFC